jgi:hypothetical protein
LIESLLFEAEILWEPENKEHSWHWETWDTLPQSPDGEWPRERVDERESF